MLNACPCSFINSLKIPTELEDHLDEIFAEKKDFVGEKIDNFEDLLTKEELNKLLLNPISHAKNKYLARLGNRQITDTIKRFIVSQGFKLFLEPDFSSGCFFYPSMEGFMGWHTNHNSVGYRMYIVKSLKGDSYFRSFENGEIITSYDPKGYSFRTFLVGDEKSPYWHCVHGGSGRFSIGFHLIKN